MYNQQLSSALAELVRHLTGDLIPITIEQPGYAGFGFTTKATVTRNVQRWQVRHARYLARQERRAA